VFTIVSVDCQCHFRFGLSDLYHVVGNQRQQILVLPAGSSLKVDAQLVPAVPGRLLANPTKSEVQYITSSNVAKGRPSCTGSYFEDETTCDVSVITGTIMHSIKIVLEVGSHPDPVKHLSQNDID